MVNRKAVTARGDALLKLLAEAGEKGLMLTQAEAHMAIKAGHAVVDTSVNDGDTAKVTITEAGKAKLAPAAKIEIDDAVPMPEAKKPGGGPRGSKYPFDALNVGQSFHVAATEENPDPVTALASSLTGARRKYQEQVFNEDGSPKVETVKVKTYATDANGKRIKGEDGHWVVTGEATEPRNVTKQTRDFIAVAVGADDPRGKGARVFRKL